MTTRAEYNLWVEFNKANKGRWTVDPAHTGEDGGYILIFCPDPLNPTGGSWVTIDGNLAQSGIYTDAVPHIGEATFKKLWDRTYVRPEQAKAVIGTRLGLNL